MATPPNTSMPTAVRVPLAGLLALAFPGLGHWFIGDRGRGMVFCAVIGVTFWGGVAIGGVRSTVDVEQRKAWFAAQLCVGSQVIVVLIGQRIAAAVMDTDEGGEGLPRAYWPSEDIAVVYTGVAGLLNLLVILDALMRAEVVAVPRGGAPPGKRKRSP